MEYVVASGALAFDGKGWPWERILVSVGLIKPELFTVVIKSLTRYPRQGNLRWWKPWSCVRLIPDGAVNKVGLTNPGIEWWCQEVGSSLNYQKYPTVGSIFGDTQELVEMALMFNQFDLVAIEVNVSCPNTGHDIDQANTVIESCNAVRTVSRHPVIVKVSIDQDFLAIAQGLAGVAEAISLNSVPWKYAFPNGERTPLWRLEQKVGGGGGGVSGKPAQLHNWAAVKDLAEQGALPIVGPSVMEYDDIPKLRQIGASAISFGAIHLRTPWLPTQFVKKEISCLKTQ